MAPLGSRCSGLRALAVVAASGPLLALAAQAPPEVEFVGGAPKLRIYPGGGSDGRNDTWIALAFGRIEELDGQGRGVPGRAIMPLVSEEGVIWTRKSVSIGGVAAVATRMELALSHSRFPEVCLGGEGGTLAKAGHDDRDDHDHDNHENRSDGHDDHDGHDGHDGPDDQDHRDDREHDKEADDHDDHEHDKEADDHDHDVREDHNDDDDEAPQSMGSGSSRRRSRLLSETEGAESGDEGVSAGSVVVEVFIFQEDAVADYGEFSIPVLRGQMKFNIEGVAWPFCGSDHKLQVQLDIQVPGGALPKEVSDRPEDGQGEVPRRPRRKIVRHAAGGMDSVVDFPEVVLAGKSSLPCEVVVAGTGVIVTFPRFGDTMLYDPTVGFVDPAAGSIDGPSSATATVVSGDLKLTVEDPPAFCASELVLLGLQQAIARAAAQDVGFVQLACSVAARRRLQARRLAGAVEVAYDISVPAGADATAASLREVTAEQLARIVNEELASAGASAMVQVTEVSSQAAARPTTAAPETASSLASARATSLTVSLGLFACASLLS